MTELQGLLARVVKLLDDAGVPFMIAGSFASAAHGLPRTTQDLDVVIDPPTPETLDALVGSLSPDAYYVDRSMFNVIDQASGWKVDFIIRKERAFSRDEFRRRARMTLLDVPVFMASAEDTIVAKLEWSAQSGGSERQRRDVAGIVATIGDALDRAYLERWIRDLGLDDEWAAAASTPL